MIIELLVEAIRLGIQHLVAHLNFQLAVYQLNNVDHVCDPMILEKYLQVILLPRVQL